MLPVKWLTEDEVDNLRDALELHFTRPVATVIPHLHSIEIDMGDTRSHSCPWVQETSPWSFSSHAAQGVRRTCWTVLSPPKS